MNSVINAQVEENFKDLQGSNAIEKITKVVHKAENCFFCTSQSIDGTCASRPMNVRKVDEQGNLWFLSPNDSHINQELALDTYVKLFFQGSPHSDFLILNGQAMVSRDQSKIEELWQPLLESWFTGGVSDPRITVIQFSPNDGYYWEAKHGSLADRVKIIVNAMIANSPGDFVEGKLEL